MSNTQVISDYNNPIEFSYYKLTQSESLAIGELAQLATPKYLIDKYPVIYVLARSLAMPVGNNIIRQQIFMGNSII